jgi:hypothetical protein
MNPDKFDESRFFPKGAMAFFSLMLGAFVVVWLFIYALMIYRA